MSKILLVKRFPGEDTHAIVDGSLTTICGKVCKESDVLNTFSEADLTLVNCLECLDGLTLDEYV